MVHFKIQAPVITVYSVSAKDQPGGLFGQLSVVSIEVETKKDIFREDLIEIVDKHALTQSHS